MTKREKRRHAVLVKKPWTKEWLGTLDERDFEIVYGVAQATLLPRLRSLSEEQQQQARLIQNEKRRRDQSLTAV